MQAAHQRERAAAPAADVEHTPAVQRRVAQHLEDQACLHPAEFARRQFAGGPVRLAVDRPVAPVQVQRMLGQAGALQHVGQAGIGAAVAV